MKTSTMLLIGGAAVVGYLYAKKRAVAMQTGAQAVTNSERVAAPVPTVVVNVEDDDYGPAWAWGAPVWGARSWGGFRGHGHGHHGGHGGHHGGHH